MDNPPSLAGGATSASRAAPCAARTGCRPAAWRPASQRAGASRGSAPLRTAAAPCACRALLFQGPDGGRMPSRMHGSDVHASRAQNMSQPCRCRWHCQRQRCRRCESQSSAHRACMRTAAARLGALGRGHLHGSRRRGSGAVAASQLLGCARRAVCSHVARGGGLSVGRAAAVRGRARRRPRRRRPLRARLQARVWPAGRVRRQPPARGRCALLASHLPSLCRIRRGRRRLLRSVGLGLGGRGVRCAGGARGQHNIHRCVGGRAWRGGRARGRCHGYSGIDRRGRRGGHAALARLPPL